MRYNITVPTRHAPMKEAAMIHNTHEPRRPGLITQLAEVLPSGAFITWWGATYTQGYYEMV